MVDCINLISKVCHDCNLSFIRIITPPFSENLGLYYKIELPLFRARTNVNKREKIDMAEQEIGKKGKTSVFKCQNSHVTFLLSYLFEIWLLVLFCFVLFCIKHQIICWRYKCIIQLSAERLGSCLYCMFVCGHRLSVCKLANNLIYGIRRIRISTVRFNKYFSTSFTFHTSRL